MAATAVEGYVHEVGFYGSDEEFGDLIVPFARDGLELGEPIVFAYDEHKTNLLRDWLPATPAVSYITDTGPYATPAKALGAWRSLIEHKLAGGAARVRIAGNVPHPGYGMSYAGWDRYEAAVDRALGDLPVWAPCLYDTRIAPTEVIQRAASLHQRVRRAGGQVANDRYVPLQRLADFLPAEADPLEGVPAAVELSDPTPSAARAAVKALVADRVAAERMDALVLGVSEAVTNAALHGVPPVSVRAWLGDGRVVVRVHDRGSGPTDPLAGLVPTPGAGSLSGRGLWIAHQLDLDVALVAAEDGFSVRFRCEVEGARATA